MGLLEELQTLSKKARAAIHDTPDHDALEKVRVAFLGRSGELKNLMGRLREVPAEMRKTVGQTANQVKGELAAFFEEAQARLGSAAVREALSDPTLPGVTQPRGTHHPLTQTVERFMAIFERLGFTVADGPEIEDAWHNFDALNIPPDHPARDDQETFAMPGARVLRSQTSTVQIRTMETQKPPIRIISPGRVYRPDAVDATHHYSFSQIEGLAVDTDITFADLKGVLDVFAREFFGEDTRVRLRPSFFPFTEPSAEVDVSCPFCHGEGCRVCKNTGWIECAGCGMVDPNVFKAVGIDAEEYTGFAFGLGIERLAMLTLGVNDIRRFTENDLRFLRQFG